MLAIFLNFYLLIFNLYDKWCHIYYVNYMTYLCRIYICDYFFRPLAHEEWRAEWVSELMNYYLRSEYACVS
jgi:hypothetical protein